MKFLIIGLGSIGSRHLKNLINLGYKKLTVVTQKKDITAEYPFLKNFYTIKEALTSESFDAAILCTPTACHITAIEELLDAKIKKIYIEKPVSHNLDGIEQILKAASFYSNKIIVGYDLHFDPGIAKVRQLIQSKEIGNVISVNASVGQYLPKWRPNEDYRYGMSAKKEMGGGVMLDLIHEFDYLYWLFGKTKQIGCFFSHSGALEIETEDVAEVIMKFETGVLASIHLDYLQPALMRSCCITGSKGTITWNLAKSKVNWITTQSKHEYDYSDFNRNDRFVSILKAFISNEDDDRLTFLTDGIESLKMVMAAKQSSIENTIISI